MANCCAAQAGSRDLTNRRWSQFLWAVSLLAIVVGGVLSSTRFVLWPAGFIIAGVLCVANAARCGRLHCYITGPLFLLAGLVSILRGFDIVSWAWESIASVAFLGAVLGCLSECFVGKYVGGQRGGANV